MASADTIYWDGVTGNWSDVTKWSSVITATAPDPTVVPGALDIAQFNITSALATVSVNSLNGNQAVAGLVFNATGQTTLQATTAGQILSLGASGITYGAGQVNLGGTNAATMVISLAASQSWTGSGGNGLIQLNPNLSATTQSLTNGTAGAVTLTFDGASTGSRSISGVINNGSLGGTTALVFNMGGGNFNLNGANTYSGGTTLTLSSLTLGNAAALGSGDLTFSNNASSKTISTSVVGGITLANNNALNLNGTITLGGSQNINFGNGLTSLGSATNLIFSNTNPAAYTFGGNISGGFGLTIGTAATLTNTLINLNGTNSYTGGTTINGGTVAFGSNAAVPTGANKVILNGGAIAISGAYTTLAGILADAQITKTMGTLALTGDSSEPFTAPNASISLGATLGSVARYTGAYTPSGSIYTLGGGGGTIVFSSDAAFSGARSIATGAFNTNIGNGGTAIITGQNTATGAGSLAGVTIGGGTVQVSSLNSVAGGTATSNLGAPTTVAGGAIHLGGSGTFSQLRYTGLGETTDRTIDAAGGSGSSFALDASGTGAVVFNGLYASVNSASNNRTAFLRGINTGANTITAGIGTQAVNPGGINLNKSHRGNWTLSGSNNFAGNSTTQAILITGGTLTADYTTNTSVLGGTPALTLGGGTLAIKGNAAGTTAQTLGSSTLTGNTGQSNISVTGNGTAGSAVLTLGNTFTRNSGAFLNFNLASGGQVTSSPAMTNSVVVGSGSIAAFTVTSGGSTDFATVISGQIAKLGAPTGALQGTGNVNTGNYSLTGDLTLGGAALANTLRIDTNAASGTLALGANSITATLGVIMKDGVNDYNITGTRLAPGGGTIVLSTYGAGALNIAGAVTDAGGNFFKTGPGLVNLTGAQAYTGSTTILGGVVRLANATFGTSNITVNTGGILEIGADLNGITAGDFSRQVGTGASQVQWLNGDGGFSAFGANRTVSLTSALGVANGQLVWGSTNGNNFVTSPNASPAFVKDGFALLLGASTGTHMLDFTNPIDLVNMPRAVVVGNGSATVDARLSGILSSSDFSGGVDKSGLGTLELTAANTYTGRTTVAAGTLRVNNLTGSGTGSGAVVVVTGATLAGTGTIGGETRIAGIHDVGNDAVGTQKFSSNLNYESGSIFEWDLAANKDTDGLDNNVGTTADNGAPGTNYDSVTITGNLAINASAVFKVIQNVGTSFDDVFWTTNQSWTNIFNVTGSLASGWSNTAVSVYNTSNVLQDVSAIGSFTITGSTLSWSAVPEPTSALAGLLIGAGLLRRRRSA